LCVSATGSCTPYTTCMNVTAPELWCTDTF
jgi:hypothetical protein